MKEIVVFAFLLLTFTAQAQDSTLYLKYEKDKDYSHAYVTDNAGNEVTGLMRSTPSYSKVVLITKSEKKVYLPRDLRSYNLEFKNYVSDGKTFYELIYKGKVGLYQQTFYVVHQYGGPTEVTESFFCKAGGKEFKKIDKPNFKMEFSKYFADCEILKSKIKQGDLTIKDLDLIRYIYNNDCKE